jgi:hypothetical protein
MWQSWYSLPGIMHFPTVNSSALCNSFEDMACCSSVKWKSAVSETVRNRTHVHVQFCLEWPILWPPRILTFPPGTLCIYMRGLMCGFACLWVLCLYNLEMCTSKGLTTDIKSPQTVRNPSSWSQFSTVLLCGSLHHWLSVGFVSSGRGYMGALM